MARVITPTPHALDTPRAHWHWSENTDSRGIRTLEDATSPVRRTNRWACNCPQRPTHGVRLNNTQVRYEPGESLIIHREAW